MQFVAGFAKAFAQFECVESAGFIGVVFFECRLSNKKASTFKKYTGISFIRSVIIVLVPFLSVDKVFVFPNQFPSLILANEANFANFIPMKFYQRNTFQTFMLPHNSTNSSKPNLPLRFISYKAIMLLHVSNENSSKSNSKNKFNCFFLKKKIKAKKNHSSFKSKVRQGFIKFNSNVFKI